MTNNARLLWKISPKVEDLQEPTMENLHKWVAFSESYPKAWKSIMQQALLTCHASDCEPLFKQVFSRDKEEEAMYK